MAYTLKAALAFPEVRAGYRHPVKLNFLAGIPISLFLLSALLPALPTLRAALAQAHGGTGSAPFLWSAAATLALTVRGILRRTLD
ncbi:MAG: hypothetical protein K6A65_06000 [Succinivibrionaceae bacterium]|nr:hypothetical protein [Succinivibrionaceae bacterium]